MTNYSYYTDNGMSLAQAVSDFLTTEVSKTKGFGFFGEWLLSERIVWKFKIGNFIKNISDSHSIFAVIDLDDKYMYVKRFNSNGSLVTWHGTDECHDRKYKTSHDIFWIRYDQQNRFITA